MQREYLCPVVGSYEQLTAVSYLIFTP